MFRILIAGGNEIEPTFFKTPSEFRKWLSRNHSQASELLVGFHKRDSGKPSMTWPESVEEALCFGWIDGIRRRIDDESYSIRFTPRRPNSLWSKVNIRIVNRLIEEKRMRPAGLAAFHARDAKRSARYSYESRSLRLAPAYEKKFGANKSAWKYFSDQPPWYRRATSSWVMSAKKPETRERRLAQLISDSAKSLWIGPLRRNPKRS